MLDRNLRRSLFDYCQDLIKYPPSGTFTTGFNVYTAIKSQYRNPAFVPVRPYVFMVDRNLEPTTSRVPLIIVEISGIAKAPYELGNRTGHIGTADLNIFGDTRGTRDDLIGFYRDNFGLTFQVYDYTTAGSPAFDTAELLDEPTSVLVSTGEEVEFEGSLYNFGVVSFDFLTRT